MKKSVDQEIRNLKAKRSQKYLQSPPPQTLIDFMIASSKATPIPNEVVRIPSFSSIEFAKPSKA